MIMKHETSPVWGRSRVHVAAWLATAWQADLLEHQNPVVSHSHLVAAIGFLQRTGRLKQNHPWSIIARPEMASRVYSRSTAAVQLNIPVNICLPRVLQ
jgi:hypothetical protein